MLPFYPDLRGVFNLNSSKMAYFQPKIVLFMKNIVFAEMRRKFDANVHEIVI